MARPKGSRDSKPRKRRTRAQVLAAEARASGKARIDAARQRRLEKERGERPDEIEAAHAADLAAQEAADDCLRPVKYGHPTDTSLRAIRTPYVKEALVAALSEGLSIAGACSRAGCSRSTYYSHLADDKDFAQAVKEAIEIGTDGIEDAMLADAMKNGQWVAKLAILKSRRRERWQENYRVAHEHVINVDAAVNRFRSWCQEVEQKARAAEIERRAQEAKLQIEGRALTVDETNAALAQAAHQRAANQQPRPEPAPPSLAEVIESHGTHLDRLDALRRETPAELLPLLPA